MKITICRREHFNAAHRIYRKDWTDERNFQVFGKCANPNFHGHNYDVIVKLTGEQSPETGYVMDMKEVGEIMKQYVTDVYDHKNLNLDVPDFADTIPTAENIVVKIYDRLRPHFSAELDLAITLYETERNFVEYAG
jgi:6-pyruvoyltetrahydropterin/6-carboxytetrahydropterin synthase